MTSYSNYRKRERDNDIKQYISYLNKKNNDINKKFNLYFEKLFKFNINSFKSGNNFNQKLLELLYYSYNKIKKEKKEKNYMLVDFYNEFYFNQKLIYEIFLGQGNNKKLTSTNNKNFFKNHYYLLIYIILDIIKIIKNEYKISRSDSESRTRSRTYSRSRSRSYSRSSLSSGLRRTLKNKSNWKNNKNYINFIKDLLPILEEQSITGIYTVESDYVKPLLELLYGYIKEFNDENEIKISNTHIVICINKLNKMSNKKHLELKNIL